MVSTKRFTEPPPPPRTPYMLYSALTDEERQRARADARALSSEIFAGLDPSAELDHVVTRHFGDGIMLIKDGKLVRA